jgi:hypothetical protein
MRNTLTTGNKYFGKISLARFFAQKIDNQLLVRTNNQ